MSLDCVRLRDFNHVRKLIGQAYTGREAASLEELQIHNNKQFVLETRQQGEEFPPDADYIIKVAKVSNDKYFEEQIGIEFGIFSTISGVIPRSFFWEHFGRFERCYFE